MDAITDTSTLGRNVISFGRVSPRTIAPIDGSTSNLHEGDEIQLENYDYNQINGTHVVETLQFADNTSMRLTSSSIPLFERQ